MWRGDDRKTSDVIAMCDDLINTSARKRERDDMTEREPRLCIMAFD